MALSTELASIAGEHFVSLTTFRKSGVGVATPVWIARDGDALLVTTPDGTGKVKRIRNNSRIELRPSSRMGKVADDAPVARGVAELVNGPDAEKRLTKIFLAKYRLEYRIFMFIERRTKTGQRRRTMIRITDAG